MATKLARFTSLAWRVATVVWAAVIFCLSTHAFRPEFSESLLATVFHLLHFHVAPGAFDLVHALLRKLAHVTEYAVFGLLLYGVSSEERLGEWRPRRALSCIVLAAAYSLTDELHQWFVPGRHASLGDCGLDTIGATLAMLIPFSWNQISFPKPAPSFPPAGTLHP
jgi:VanZ family protein